MASVFDRFRHVLLFASLAALAAATSYALDVVWDNDVYFLIATGRSIASSGISSVEPLAMHDGLDYMAQQWLSALIDGALYDAGGRAAVSLFHTGVWLVAGGALYAAALSASGGRRVVSAAAAGLALLLCAPVAKSNPRGFDMVAFALCVLLASRFVGTGRKAHLAGVVAACAVLANLHVSMWPVCAVPLVAALFDARCSMRSRAWLLAACLGCAAASCATPYGPRGALYVFESLSSDSFDAFAISEVAPLDSGSLVFWPLAALAVAYAFFRGRRGGALRLEDALAAGSALLAFSSVRSYPLLVFALAVAFARASKDASLPDPAETSRPLLAAALCSPLLAAAVLAPQAAGNVGFGAEETSPERVERAEAVSAIVAEEGEGARVFALFNDGGSCELAGLRPYIDARAEVFAPELNGGRDIASEYMGYQKGWTDFAVLDGEYGFDAVLFDDSFALRDTYAQFEEAGFERVYGGERYSAWTRR